MASQIRTLDLRGRELSVTDVRTLIPRASVDVAAAMESIAPLLEAVRTDGEAAIVKETIGRDGVDPSPLRVSAGEIDAALGSISRDLRAAIELSIERVRKVSEANMPRPTTVQTASGASVSQRWQPVDSVGLYVPGGKAVYPSSVVMNVVPAQVAQVPRLVIASPAQLAFDGRPHPTVLATAGILGVEEVYSMGGPAAIAAFAYGLPSRGSAPGMEPVALVTGPGNIYVTAAKRALRGRIGIDAEAGTTEILVLADSSADARLIAYDLISQAEHDEAAAAVLVTDSPELIESVATWVVELAKQAHHRERVATALAGIQSALVLVDNWDRALFVTNAYATEHLELHCANPADAAAQISNAGAIFLGQYSPVSLGDYLAGSSHVLPTGAAASFSAGLGVHSFLRAQQLVNYSAAALEAVATPLVSFAEAEGLPAHGNAVSARFRDR